MRITDDFHIVRYRTVAAHGWWMSVKPCPRCYPAKRHYLMTNGNSWQCDVCGYHIGTEHLRGPEIESRIDPRSIGQFAGRRARNGVRR